VKADGEGYGRDHPVRSGLAVNLIPFNPFQALGCDEKGKSSMEKGKAHPTPEDPEVKVELLRSGFIKLRVLQTKFRVNISLENISENARP
jgi:hypothetical protein